MPAYFTDNAEPGTMVEVLLPKRMEYQAKLFEALQDGLNIRKVRDYFLARGVADADDEKRRIRELLPGRVRAKYTDQRVKSIQQVYFGCSLYEVDGVFVMDPSNPERERTQERTQIIRLLFKPDTLHELIQSDPSLTPEQRSIVRDEIQLFRMLPAYSRDEKTVEGYLAERPHLREIRELPKYLNEIDEWGADVLLFVFGYIVGKLTGDIAINEKEIWVTSFRNTVVNVVRRGERPTPRYAGPPKKSRSRKT